MTREEQLDGIDKDLSKMLTHLIDNPVDVTKLNSYFIVLITTLMQLARLLKDGKTS